ncbi:MAG: hypothetical protein ACI9JL_004211 [Paracoccaceae bacterium]|jgi:hypothetical protein
MSDMKAFEIHTYQSGKWKIDSVFDDRDLAMFEAQRMDESGRYTSIRVVEEIYVESTQETKTRTIFRGSKVAAANAAQLRKSRESRQDKGQTTKKRQADTVQRKRVAQKRKNKKKANPVRLILIMIMIAAAAGGAMYGLMFLQGGL